VVDEASDRSRATGCSDLTNSGAKSVRFPLADYSRAALRLVGFGEFGQAAMDASPTRPVEAAPIDIEPFPAPRTTEEFRSIARNRDKDDPAERKCKSDLCSVKQAHRKERKGETNRHIAEECEQG